MAAPRDPGLRVPRVSARTLLAVIGGALGALALAALLGASEATLGAVAKVAALVVVVAFGIGFAGGSFRSGGTSAAPARGGARSPRTGSFGAAGLGAGGEARVAALATLNGSDAATAAKLAKQSRRGDPVLALRAAERALAAPGLSALERGVMEELIAQARKDARNAGVVVLDARAEAEAARQRGAKTSPAQAAPSLVTTLVIDPSNADADAADDDAALALDGAADDDEQPAGQDEANAAFFERGAVDLTPEASDQWQLPDPEIAGDAALVDALHAALGAGTARAEAAHAETAHAEAEPTLDEADEAPAESGSAEPEVLADDTDPGAATTVSLGAEDVRETMQLERTTVSLRRVDEPSLAPPSAPPPSAAPRAEPPAKRAPSSDEFAFGEAPSTFVDEELGASAPLQLRTLHVSVGKPERLGRAAIVLEIEGRGRAKLAYEKIDAVAAAGVRGLSSNGKAVLLVDLAIGYSSGEGPLRVVRMRADGFDPRDLMEGHTSPLVALRALIAELRQRTHAAALPREVDANAPFRIYADLATYEREAFGAESAKTASAHG